MLEMEDGDVVHAMIEQQGGGGEGDGAEGGEVPITITVRDAAGTEVQFKVKKTTKFEKIFGAYAQRLGINTSSLRFVLDGNRVTGDQTPKMLEMEDGDQLDVRIEQVGGYFDRSFGCLRYF